MSNKIPVTQIYSPPQDLNRSADLKSTAAQGQLLRGFDTLASRRSSQGKKTTGSSLGKVYTKRVRGYFQILRRKLNIVLIGIFVAIPWFNIGTRPAVFFDLQEQKFHIFTLTFWPQDAIFLVALLLLASFLLVAVTLVLGRAWCGFSCPQTIWSLLFIWVEDKCEGDRNQRIKLDAQGWNQSKVIRKSVKHICWIVLSLITAYTFIGYFYPIKTLVVDSLHLKVNYTALFWLVFFSLATYLNAGWLREKVCLHMCPYARFQAVMYTQDTLVVTYDAQRGENRGARNTSKTAVSGLGDCVDCSLCVVVCPVDIDIRDGLQYPCINCGLCVDACNNVMQKMGYKQDLIRFTSHNDPLQKKSIGPRSKALITAIFSVAACVAFAYLILIRAPLSLDVIRDRSGLLYGHSAEGIENIYQVKINNKAVKQSIFVLEIDSNLQYKIVTNPNISVRTGEVGTLLVKVIADSESRQRASRRFNFVIKDSETDQVLASQETRFIAPL